MINAMMIQINTYIKKQGIHWFFFNIIQKFIDNSQNILQE